MQIRGLSLRNIRSFEQADVTLGPGTTLIVGDVGAGKTSLLYAIEMALFGVAEVDAAHLVRHGRTDAEVKAVLEDREHRYEVARTFRRLRRRGRETFEPQTITFVEDGRPTSYSATELRRRVIEIVGFPDNPNPQAHSDLWRWAIYVPQERMREILAADPEERLETVRKALGVERFRTAAENASALASDLRTDARRRREESGRLAYWDEELAKALAEGETLRVEERRRSEELAAIESDLASVRASAAVHEAEAARVAADRRELAALEAEAAADVRTDASAERRRSELEHERRAADEERTTLSRTVALRAETRARLSGAEEERRHVLSELERTERELRGFAEQRAARKALERSIEDLKRREAAAAGLRTDAARELETAASEGPVREPPAPTPRGLSELDQALVGARAVETTAVERSARARADLGAIDQLLERGVCPTCHREVSPEDLRSHRTEISLRAEEAEAERRRCESARTTLEEERRSRERYERAHERWTEVERRRVTLRQTLATQERALAELHAELERSNRSLATDPLAEGRATKAEARLAELRHGLEQVERERSRWASESEASARAEERVGALERLLARTAEDLERLTRERSERADRVRSRAATLDALRTRLAGAEALEAEVEKLRNALARKDEDLARARAVLVRVQTRREALGQRVALAERGRADRLALVEEAAQLEGRAGWISEPLRYHLLAMEKDLLAHAQASFDRSFSRYFAALIDDPGMVARTDSAFTPQVTINGESTAAEALSGGERTALALAFRLALASTVRALGEVRLESLLLDEPTDGFSAEQVVRMGELLEQLSLPQVVVVSHEAQLAGIADRTLRVVKRDGRSVLEGSDAELGPAPSERLTVEAAAERAAPAHGSVGPDGRPAGPAPIRE